MVTKEEWIKNLKQDTYEVTFNKKNGEERIMTCTLQESFIPQKSSSSTEKSRKEPTTDVVSCYDLNAKGWRSFNASNVTSYKKMDKE